MYYLIRETLEPCGPEAIRAGDGQYVAVLTPEEWRRSRDFFAMGIDMDTETMGETKAVVNYDSLTGSLAIPSRMPGDDAKSAFSFALDEKGVVFIDDGDRALALAEAVRRTKKWRLPSLERFLYDFLEQIIAGDLATLESMEQKLIAMEEQILRDEEPDLTEMSDIRGMLLDLRLHYEQLGDFGQELEENENGFFKTENLRYFRLFSERVQRLQDTVSSLREYTGQLRDLMASRADRRQNRIMTLLTVITSIFMPLTLITGWYGMNFRYMPELESPAGYPIVIGVCAAIVIGCLIYFKKKKWL